MGVPLHQVSLLVADSEKTLIFHHEQLNKSRKRSSILKLINQEGNLVEGHKNCASVLQEEARALLDNPSILDSKAQEELLSFVDEVFTDEDNKLLDSPITDEVCEAVAARGTV